MAKKNNNIDDALKFQAQGKLAVTVAAAGPIPLKIVTQEVLKKIESVAVQVEVANRTEVDGRTEN